MSQQALNNEQVYLKELAALFELSTLRSDRTGTGTLSRFGCDQRYDIRNGAVPLLSTKHVHVPSIIHELVWMLSGDTSIKYLMDNNVRIWNEWLVPDTEIYDENGKLVDGQTSSIYGESWRHWTDTRYMSYAEVGDIPAVDRESRMQEKYTFLGSFKGKELATRTIDQIARIQWQLKHKPNSRSIILSGWNVARLSDVKLPPCHLLAQFYVDSNVEGVPELSCKLTIRSSDYFLGKPFNVAFYAILTHMLAKAAGMVGGDLIISTGDQHLYINHLEQVKEQLSRTPLENNNPTVNIDIPLGGDITTLTYDDIVIEGYQHLPSIKAPVAV